MEDESENEKIQWTSWAALFQDAGRNKRFKNIRDELSFSRQDGLFQFKSAKRQEQQKTELLMLFFLCLWCSSLYFCASFRGKYVFGLQTAKARL